MNSSRFTKHWAAALVAFGLLCTVVVAPTANAAGANSGVLPPNSRSHGMTYGEWSAAWWQWALSGTAADNPVADPTGASCAVRQTAAVWFLAGTFGGDAERTCTVPAGKALFFPIINTVWANDPGGTATEDEVRAAARADLVGATASAEIDGTAITNLQGYLVESPTFTLVLSDDNVLGAPGGTYAPAAAAGIHLLLAPLAPGSHLVRFRGCFANGFCAGAVYHLTVSADT